jgi:large subunit ribosomal protein L18
MITQTKRNAIRQRIHQRIRRKLAGTAERPRLNVYRSLNHIYAQVIDDQKGETLVSASTIKMKTGGNIASAKEIGKSVAELAVKQGIKKVVFDRGGYLYHGRIKALADAARAAGLEF